MATFAIAGALVGGALWWRSQVALSLPEPPKTQKEQLPRTRKLVEQKVGSLEAYNQVIPTKIYLREFSNWTGERPVKPEAFDVMSRLMVAEIVPQLWREAQKIAGDAKLVTHQAMAKAVHSRWPQQLLPNGHVVLFPGHPILRKVASEYRQDYFRDTGWHWRWIGQAIEQKTLGNLEEINELDIYAAEEFSEFLSVLAVGLLEWSDHFHYLEIVAAQEKVRIKIRAEEARMLEMWRRGEITDLQDPDQKTKHWKELDKEFKKLLEEVDSSVPVDADVMRQTIAKLKKFATESATVAEVGPALYSALTRELVTKGVPQPMFKEATKRWGLGFQHTSDPDLIKRRTELVVPTGIAGGGVSAGDFDDDGFVDLYFAGGGGGQLLLNVEGKRFQDASRAAGLTRDGETRAGYFIDFDNDGDLDLFLTFVFRPNQLYRNEGGGKFVDVTEESGIGGGKQVTHEAVWFDYDNDGLLDVYVANFGLWPNGSSPDLTIHNNSAPPNQLYHHLIVEGRHVFEEVAAKMRVDDRGWTHCVGAWDFNQDGWMDLISLNDFGQSIAYRNDDGRQFVEETRALHLDVVYNAMNFHLIDLDQTGHPAVYITEISKLTHLVRYPKPVQGTQIKFDHLDNMRALVFNKLLRRMSNGVFEDVHDIHIEPAQLGWAWDASTFDYENDGDLDLLVLNGTEGNPPEPAVKNKDSAEGRKFMSRHAGQHNVFFLSQDRYFYDVSPKCELAYKGNSRGSAWFDFDNDGDLDVAISNYQGPGRIFENVQASGNHWLRLQLEGTRRNRNAIGARVEIRFGKEKRFGQIVSGKGFLSQNPMTLHFGLGKADKVDEIIVTWPGDSKPRPVNLKELKLAIDQVNIVTETDSQSE